MEGNDFHNLLSKLDLSMDLMDQWIYQQVVVFSLRLLLLANKKSISTSVEEL